MEKTFNKEHLSALGTYLKGVRDQYVRDRGLLEDQWMKNLRQYLGIYDPSISKYIPEERSHVYPRDTRVKIKGGVAKMMEMMFPSQDKNWTVSPSPNPSIPQADLQQILNTLQAEPGTDPTEAIERGIREVAKSKAMKMETEISDQLSDAGVDYPQLCKRVVRSGYIYGYGVARSPLVRTQSDRQWTMNALGQYEAVTKKVRRPYPEYVRAWDIYPDLSAKEWIDQEMMFERVVLMRSDFRRLADRPDFMKEEIREYLNTNTTGNYVAQAFESELHSIAKTSNLADRTSRRYELYRCVGFVSGATLSQMGMELTEAEIASDVFVEVWLVDDHIIKADKAAFGDRPSDQYHAFIYAEDEDSGLTGIGLPDEVRDSQMSLCASTRALMDNMASCAGPIFEVNTSLLARGKKNVGPIHSFMTIEREGDGQEAQYPAVRAITNQSHVGEILSIIEMQRQQLDIESNLPAYTMGAMQQPLGEAFRTSNNMSMMMGSANMVTKDTVRAFDKFTTSLISSLLRWNMEFNPNTDIKGDYEVVAKGNLSLVAKEVRGAALDQFVMTLTPEDRAILDTYGLLIDRLKARDLPVDRVLPEDEAKKVLDSMKEAASQASQIEQGLTQAKTQATTAKATKDEVDAKMVEETAEATVKEIMSRIEANMAKASSMGDKNQLENLKVLLSTVQKEGGDDAKRKGGGDK